MVETRKLSKRYAAYNKNGQKTCVDAVKQVTLSFDDHQSYALVGESGSGKSTLARMLMCIERPTGGELLLDGKNILSMPQKELRLKRAEFQMVLQNAQSALDPRLRVYDSIAEPLRRLTSIGRSDIRKRILEVSEQVRFPATLLCRLPHELSGGQLKRVCIARALSVAPKFIVFDESVSGLDVTVRKQILDLILQLKKESLSTFLFITHDIDVAMYIAEHVVVMKDGDVVEQIKNAGSYSDFTHAYSRLLIESLPPQMPKTAG